MNMTKLVDKLSASLTDKKADWRRESNADYIIFFRHTNLENYDSVVVVGADKSTGNAYFSVTNNGVSSDAFYFKKEHSERIKKILYALDARAEKTEFEIKLEEKNKHKSEAVEMAIKFLE